MQNRNMFPFRRQGPKKRNKNNNPRKARGPQKALPNSARDMVGALQQATKALAQMLAGRSNPSGQVAYAQSALAHAERLIGDRQHNRLNPSEREEFFEQLARLRLTIADAESEAQTVAAEEQQPKPQVRPVDQERLRAMALALSRPEPAPNEEVNGHSGRGGPQDAENEAGPDPDVAKESAEPAGEPAAVSQANARSGRLQLSRSGSEQAADVLGEPVGPARPRRLRARPAPDPAAAVKSASPAAPAATNGASRAARRPEAASGEAEAAANGQSAPAEPVVASGKGAESVADDRPVQSTRPRRAKTTKGLPEGWVIDDEGFVVPGPR
jgi:hypothetical protein